MNMHARTKIGKGWLVSVLFGLILGLAGVPALAERGPAAPEGGPVRATLERVSEALKALESELSALDAPAAERLEERVEDVVESLSGVLARMDAGEIDREDPAVRKKLIEIDLKLHRLIYRLSEVAEGGAHRQTPQLRRIIGRFTDRLEAAAFRLDGFILAKAAK